MARKLVLLLAACSLVGSGLAGCGEDEEDEAGADTRATTPTTTKRKPAVEPGRGRVRVRDAGGSSKAIGQEETEELDVSHMAAEIEQAVEAENPGIDAQVECPDTVPYTTNAVFWCKLYMPDAWYDVKCTVVTDTYITWEIIR